VVTLRAISLCRRVPAGHRTGGVRLRASAHDPEKLVLDLIGDGYRFSDKIVRQ